MRGDWRKHWQTYPVLFSETDFLSQVGKTVRGKPIGFTQVESILSSILSNLNLNKDDSVIDICCGNGFITGNLAKNCRIIDGIDYSEYLIDIAKRHNCPKNSCYTCHSLFDIEDNIDTLINKPYDKVLMYEALQHFQTYDIIKILKIIKKITHDNSIILFGSIPDIQKKWLFYNTPDRRRKYFQKNERGDESIGVWWEKMELLFAAEMVGFICEFRNQPDILHTAHYRFDLVLKKTNK